MPHAYTVSETLKTQHAAEEAVRILDSLKPRHRVTYAALHGRANEFCLTIEGPNAVGVPTRAHAQAVVYTVNRVLPSRADAEAEHRQAVADGLALSGVSAEAVARVRAGG